MLHYYTTFITKVVSINIKKETTIHVQKVPSLTHSLEKSQSTHCGA